jgi:putative Holliday junction resolvase
MKYIGIDYGTKRVGLATSDDQGKMAFPFRVLLNSRSLAAHIAKICRDEKVDTIVMGESLNFQNTHNPIMKDIEGFVSQLKTTTNLPVIYMNEVLSSREAMHIQGDNDQNDASAAAIVLQSYLDKINPPLPTDDEEPGVV